MLVAGFDHAHEAVDHLLITVVGQVEPGVVLYGHAWFGLAEGHGLLAPNSLNLSLLLRQRTVDFAQGFDVFVLEGGGYAFEGVYKIGEVVLLVDGYILLEEFPCASAVLGCNDVGIYSLFFGLLGIGFLLEFYVVANQDYDGADDYDDGDVESTEVHGCDQCSGEDEGCASSYEPSTDDGDDARDAKYGTLTTPSTVGQRGAHGHHKGDVGCREWQFERCAEGNQETCEDQIDRGTNHVEGGALWHYGFGGVEACGNPAADVGGGVVLEPFANVAGEADYVTGGT